MRSGADARAKAEEAAEIDALDPFSLASATDSSADGSGPEGRNLHPSLSPLLPHTPFSSPSTTQQPLHQYVQM